MDLAVSPFLRPPETAEWTPVGLREPPTRWLRGRLDEVAAALPDFERGPFAMAPESEGPWHANELFDLISTRQADGWVRRPVSVVGKGYRLIGHREAIGRIAEVLADIGFDAAALDTHATLERYGARLALEVQLGSRWMVDPGDGHPLMLQLRCLNSVDASSSLRVVFNWYRLVCTNGLVVGFSQQAGRVLHRKSPVMPDLREEIANGLTLARTDRAAMRHWLERRIRRESLVPFADGPLRDAWGARDAARFLHIARTGHDAEFENRFEAGRPSEKRMTANVAVPGSPREAHTEWDAAQALSWVARDQCDPAAYLERLLEIPALVAKLSKT